MGGKSLVIVESPTKAKTISKFLGKEFIVKASNGHIRDLPNNASEVPLKLKKEKWAKLGVNIEQDFEPLYVIPARKKDHVKDLKAAVKDATKIFLATDEDREGESISWHLLETLAPKVPVSRLVFHEITKEAIDHALKTAREVDMSLVRAQETRRIVDRLFGYEVSPILWKKMAPGLSAGRVQSVAVRLLTERERERISFVSATFWSLKTKFQQTAETSQPFEAELTHVGDKRVASGKDFDPKTGLLTAPQAAVALTEKDAKALLERVTQSTPTVSSVEEKPYSNKPAPPFVTSTLQQEANRKLRFPVKYTMSLAQQLYENGFITYMRTDSTTLSEEALNGARSFIKQEYGDAYLPKAPRLYSTQVKNAQEAHEAIRPAGESFTPIPVVREKVGADAANLYELIWKRTVASQMENSRGTFINVGVTCGDAKFRASGKTIEFPGFLRAYVEGSDDPEAELADQEKSLPKVTEGESLVVSSVEPSEHATTPPPRYTEGSIIKELERLGIGRPSTWATIVDLVLSRSYAFKKGNALVPTFTAMAVVNLLTGHFARLLDYDFTARLEDDLDAIARGEAENISYLKTFYFGNGHPGLKALVSQGQENIDPRIVCGIPLGRTEDGRNVEVRIGRYGPFISDSTQRASVPEIMAPDELTLPVAVEMLTKAAKEPEALGVDPQTNLPVYLKNGRFGPYVQLGQYSEDGDKPKMASLLPGTDPQTVDLEQALKLLSLPRTVGINPENGTEIVAANGRYGPYVKCGTETRSIDLNEMSPISITLEQALEVLKQPKRRGRATAKITVLRDLGPHPESKKQIVIKSGRYGPYVTDGEINASLRKGMDPATISMDDAVVLLTARAESILANPQKKKKSRGSAGGTKKSKKKSPPDQEAAEA